MRLWHEAYWEIKALKTLQCRSVWKLKRQKDTMFAPHLDVEPSFAWQAQCVLHLAKSEQYVSEGFVAVTKNQVAGVQKAVRAMFSRERLPQHL